MKPAAGGTMKKQLAILTALLSLSFLAHADDPPNFPFIVVNGEASIDVKPDRAKITFNIVEFDKDPKVASTAVSQRGGEIIKAAAEFGVGKDQITSTAVQKEARRARDQNYAALEILGYEVSQNFAIELKDTSRYPALADKLLTLKNVASLNSEFDVSNRDEITSTLVKTACESAKKKAGDLAAGLDVKLGKPFAVTQDSDFSSFTAAFWVPNEARPMAFAKAEMRASDSSNMFVPKTINITKHVNVVYKIDQ
jgi:uncharacterized protein YggE